jgi:hypothetical protein
VKIELAGVAQIMGIPATLFAQLVTPRRQISKILCHQQAETTQRERQNVAIVSSVMRPYAQVGQMKSIITMLTRSHRSRLET